MNSTATSELRASAHASTRLCSTTAAAAEQVAWYAAAAAAALTPIVYSTYTHDTFTAPKELILRGTGIVAVAALVVRIVSSPRQFMDDFARHRVAGIVIGAAVAWTLVATAFSTQPMLSIWSSGRVIVCAAIAMAVVLGAPRRPLSAVYVVIAPAVVNAAVLLSQHLGLWDPIYPPEMRAVRSALIGNTNWIGVYLLPCALAASALALSTARRRLIHTSIAVSLGFALFLTQSAASIGAYVIGFFAIGVMLSLRKAVAALLLTVLIGGSAVALSAPLRSRIIALKEAVAQRDYNRLSSYRLTAWAAALWMFRDDPLTGAGPGTYSLNYFDKKILLESRYPLLEKSADRFYMFGEAHSDHLEMLAVAGLPGYVILAAALVLLGQRSRIAHHRSSVDAREALASTLSFPLALSVGVVMLAQFPLQLPSATVALLFTAGLCIGWSDAAGVR